MRVILIIDVRDTTVSLACEQISFSMHTSRVRTSELVEHEPGMWVFLCLDTLEIAVFGEASEKGCMKPTQTFLIKAWV